MGWFEKYNPQIEERLKWTDKYFTTIVSNELRKSEKHEDVQKYVEQFKQAKKKADQEAINHEEIDVIVGGAKRLEKLTVIELKERAKKRKIAGYSKMCKAELVAAMRRK
jgi:hypothetical protein